MPSFKRCQLKLFLADHKRIAVIASTCVSTGKKSEPEGRQNSTWGRRLQYDDVPGEGEERLAEIFREIFALSEANRPNHSKFAVADDSIKLFDAQAASGTPETCAPQGKQTSEKRSKPEDQDSLC
jgi:hypothetical protein